MALPCLVTILLSFPSLQLTAECTLFIMQSSHVLSQGHEDGVLFFKSQNQLYKCLGIDNRSTSCTVYVQSANNARFCVRPINKNNLKARPKLLEKLLHVKIPSTQAHHLLEELSHCVVCGVTKWHQKDADHVFKDWCRRLWVEYLLALGLEPERCRWTPKRLEKDVWVKVLETVRNEQQSLSVSATQSYVENAPDRHGQSIDISHGDRDEPQANIPRSHTTTSTLGLVNGSISGSSSLSSDNHNQEHHRNEASAALEGDGLRFEPSSTLDVHCATMKGSVRRLQVYRDSPMPVSSTTGASSSASPLTSQPPSSLRRALHEQNRNAPLRRQKIKSTPGLGRPCLNDGSAARQSRSSARTKPVTNPVITTRTSARSRQHEPECGASYKDGRPGPAIPDWQSNGRAMREYAAHVSEGADTESNRNGEDGDGLIINATAENPADQPDEEDEEMLSRRSEEDSIGAGDEIICLQSFSLSDVPDEDDIASCKPSPSPGPTNFRIYRLPVSSRDSLMSILNSISQFSGRRNRAPGYVYAFARPMLPGFLKIGYTNAIERPGRLRPHPVDHRLARWASDCGHPLTEVFRVYMPCAAERMESLIHQTLREHRRIQNPGCRSCQLRKGRGGRHDEWFEVDLDTARKTVHAWALFSRQRPYDALGRTVDFWARKMENDRRGVDYGLSADKWLEDMPRYIEDMVRQDLISLVTQMFSIIHHLFWLMLVLQGGVAIPLCIAGVYVLFF